MMFARTMEQQQQQQQQDDGRDRNLKRPSPLAQLAERLSIQPHHPDYSPTKEEVEAVAKCKKEILTNDLKYPLLFGVVAGTVSYRLQVLTRGFIITVSSAFGFAFGRKKTEYACLKHLISLEGSPIKTTLVDILQRDYPNHPLLREFAKNHSAPFEGDETSEANFFSEGKERGFSVETKGLATLVGSPPEYGTEGREGQLGDPRGRSTNVVNRRELHIDRRQAPNTRDSDVSEGRYEHSAPGVSTDILVDPFSFVVWTDMDDTLTAAKENQVTSRREVRRSRMTSEQKREHDRRLREQREGWQHRQPNGI